MWLIGDESDLPSDPIREGQRDGEGDGMDGRIRRAKEMEDSPSSSRHDGVLTTQSPHVEAVDGGHDGGRCSIVN